MAVQLLSLRHVFEDEADEIRQLLTTHRIEFYETPPGNWGISMPAIWLQDADDLEIAKALLATYQAERGQRIRDEYEQLKAAGLHRTILDEIRENPLKVIAFVALAIAIAYVSINPFMEISR
ncbi:MAG: hypothetical protein KJ914_17955 [Gammaproteobacteria bacterium]|nr:hypothetical protein [Gammaproteobacteria bacterium]MBU1724240.1 hypothetical protein [Gammaproteobacteria bacterium]MBU2006332.1 hypothetical protein [Gammaproteobacteria bacterium]